MVYNGHAGWPSHQLYKGHKLGTTSLQQTAQPALQRTQIRDNLPTEDSTTSSTGHSFRDNLPTADSTTSSTGHSFRDNLPTADSTCNQLLMTHYCMSPLPVRPFMEGPLASHACLNEYSNIGC